ncbi:MAG: lysophospholipid acyltransferase family protein [Bdellovibrionaceae bacterium]|nr:lysophospholipid acyltransferase family protein [Pseudobdellovibrionaceae bacterium]
MNLLFHFCIKLMSWFCQLIGWRASRWLFSLLGILWFDILRVRRKDVIKHIGMAFPLLGEDEKIKMGRRSMRLQTSHAADLFILPSIDQAWIDRHVVYEGVEHVERTLEQKKGVLILGMHVGSGDLAASLIALKKWNMHLITKFFKNKKLNDIWFALRGYHGVQYIEPHGEKTPFQILKALKANGLVGFVLDQFMGKPYGIETSFFGIKTGTAQGLALFHLKTKSPIIPAYCYEDASGRIHMVFEPALNVEGYLSSDKEESIFRLTQYFCDVTESIIRRHPEHWMWLHRRWKKFE